jgi:WhiB family redox-sensing transcriptional regulator
MKPDEIDWTEGLCSETDPDIFFPEKGEHTSSHAAKRVCASCPLVVPCLTGALERNEEFGIWGGSSYKNRQNIRKGRITIEIHLAELSTYKKGQ